MLKNKTEKLLIAPLKGLESLVKITDQDGLVIKEFLAFDKKFKGGVYLSSGDTNGDGVKEIILALNPDIPGENTILFLTRLLRPLNTKITRLARGLPMGSELEYADPITLSSALEGRQTL